MHGLSLGIGVKYRYIHFQKGGSEIMKYVLILILVTVAFKMYGQIRNRNVVIPNAFTENLPVPSEKSPSLLQTWLKGDDQRFYRLSVPLLTQKATTTSFTTDAYWTGYMTTQSMRKGKLGTYYFWDVQGNLRESRFFVDVNRKNKFSFKIVVPRN